MRKRIFIIVLSILIFTSFISGCSEEGKNKRINSLSDLSGKILSVQIGSSNATDIKNCEKLKDATVKYCTNESAEIAALLSKKSDAIIVDYIVAKDIVNRYDSMYIVDEKLSDSEYGFGFNTGDELCEKFNSVLNEFKNDGTLDEMINKWTSEGDKSIERQNWRSSRKGVIKCGVSATMEPICYKDSDDAVVGFDVDLVTKIAKELNLNVLFVDMEFDDLEPSLQSGQIDLMASGITITEERKEKYDFTDGYLPAGSVAVVNNSDDASAEGTVISLKESFKRTFMDEGRWKEIINGLVTTAILIVSTITVGLAIGTGMFMLSYFVSEKIGYVFDKIFNIHLLLPLSTWLLICYYLIFSSSRVTSFFIAFVALSVRFGVAIYDAIASAVKKVPKSQIDAAVSLGYKKYVAFKKIYLPQIMENFIGDLNINAIYHVRDTSLVEFIAVQDIQAIADMIAAQTAEPFVPIIMTAVVYIIFAFLVSKAIEYIGKLVIPKHSDEESTKNRIIGRIEK